MQDRHAFMLQAASNATQQYSPDAQAVIAACPTHSFYGEVRLLAVPRRCRCRLALLRLSNQLEHSFETWLAAGPVFWTLRAGHTDSKRRRSLLLELRCQPKLRQVRPHLPVSPQKLPGLRQPTPSPLFHRLQVELLPSE